MELEIPFNF